MIELGLLHFFLGIQVLQMGDDIFFSQPKYVLNLLQNFKMGDCKLCSSPYHLGFKLTKECDSMKVDSTLYWLLFGSLIYLTHSWPNISFAIGVVSHFMLDLHASHLNATKKIVSYIKRDYKLGIKYYNT